MFNLKKNKMEIYKAELSKKYENPIGLEFYTFYLEKSKRGTECNKKGEILNSKLRKMGLDDFIEKNFI